MEVMISSLTILTVGITWMQNRLSPYPSNAVINQEGEKERVNHWVNKKRKIGGDVHASMKNKLKFLYENGRRKQVGMYIRNQNISDESFNEQ